MLSGPIRGFEGLTVGKPCRTVETRCGFMELILWNPFCKSWSLRILSAYRMEFLHAAGFLRLECEGMCTFVHESTLLY